MTDYGKLASEIEAFVKENVKKSRYEHSVRVAETCVRLCRKFDMDVEKGWFIGIAHDMCKDFPKDEMQKLAEKDGMPIYDMEREKPSLFHGRAAAVYLEEHYGVTDPELLEAIAVHVSGSPDMGDYAKVLYIADKTEPGRDHLTAEYRAELMKLSLDGMMYKVITDNFEYIKSQGYCIYPGTEKTIAHLKASL